MRSSFPFLFSLPKEVLRELTVCLPLKLNLRRDYRLQGKVHRTIISLLKTMLSRSLIEHQNYSFKTRAELKILTLLFPILQSQIPHGSLPVQRLQKLQRPVFTPQEENGGESSWDAVTKGSALTGTSTSAICVKATRNGCLPHVFQGAHQLCVCHMN